MKNGNADVEMTYHFDHNMRRNVDENRSYSNEMKKYLDEMKKHLGSDVDDTRNDVSNDMWNDALLMRLGLTWIS